MNVAPFLRLSTPAEHTFPTLPFCNSLTFLSLAFVHVSDQLLGKLLFSCPTLEFLSVTYSNLLVDLKVVGLSLNLKSLAILDCFEIKRLEISAPNLEFFHYIGPTISSPFKSVPKLTRLTIGGAYADHLLPDLLDLSSFITQIQVLTIRSLYQVKRMAEVFPICTRVKTLDIDINHKDDVQLFRLRFLLNACPMLHKFAVRLHPMYEIAKTENTINVEVYPHRQLKIIDIFEFVGWEAETSFLIYLIESAVCLEKMIIRPTTMPTDEFGEDYNKHRKRAINNTKGLLKLKPGLVFLARDSFPHPD